MGGLFSPSVSTPPPPPAPPPAAIPATAANSTVKATGQSNLARAGALASQTVKTSEQGDLVKPTTAAPGLTG